MTQPYENTEDDKIYKPVTFHKNAGNTGKKIHPEN